MIHDIGSLPLMSDIHSATEMPRFDQASATRHRQLHIKSPFLSLHCQPSPIQPPASLTPSSPLGTMATHHAMPYSLFDVYSPPPPPTPTALNHWSANELPSRSKTSLNSTDMLPPYGNPTPLLPIPPSSVGSVWGGSMDARLAPTCFGRPVGQQPSTPSSTQHSMGPPGLASAPHPLPLHMLPPRTVQPNYAAAEVRPSASRHPSYAASPESARATQTSPTQSNSPTLLCNTQPMLKNMSPPPHFPCAKLTNIPWDVSQNDVRNFFGNCRLPSPSRYAQAIHILMDRSTGKTLSDAYVEFNSVEDLQRAIETRHQKPLKGRIVSVIECKQDELLSVVFSKWRGQFHGVNAIPPASDVVKSMSTAAGGGSSICPPFMTREEINSLLVVCKNYKLHFSRKCAERPFENIITVITKYPWHQADLITTMHRDHIYEMLKLAIESLKTHLAKDYVHIESTLLERLARSGVMCPAFTERQKLTLLQTARLECPSDIAYLMTPSTPVFSPLHTVSDGTDYFNHLMSNNTGLPYGLNSATFAGTPCFYSPTSPTSCGLNDPMPSPYPFSSYLSGRSAYLLSEEGRQQDEAPYPELKGDISEDNEIYALITDIQHCLDLDKQKDSASYSSTSSSSPEGGSSSSSTSSANDILERASSPTSLHQQQQQQQQQLAQRPLNLSAWTTPYSSMTGDIWRMSPSSPPEKLTCSESRITTDLSA